VPSSRRAARQPPGNARRPAPADRHPAVCPPTIQGIAVDDPLPQRQVGVEIRNGPGRIATITVDERPQEMGPRRQVALRVGDQEEVQSAACLFGAAGLDQDPGTSELTQLGDVSLARISGQIEGRQRGLPVSVEQRRLASRQMIRRRRGGCRCRQGCRSRRRRLARRGRSGRHSGRASQQAQHRRQQCQSEAVRTKAHGHG
jgi:hypothetical protein